MKMVSVLILGGFLFLLGAFYILAFWLGGEFDRWRLERLYEPIMSKGEVSDYYRGRYLNGIYYVTSRRRGDGLIGAFAIPKVEGADHKSFRVHEGFGIDDSSSFWMDMKLPFHIPNEPIESILDAESWHPIFVTQKAVYAGSALHDYRKILELGPDGVRAVFNPAQIYNSLYFVSHHKVYFYRGRELDVVEVADADSESFSFYKETTGLRNISGFSDFDLEFASVFKDKKSFFIQDKAVRQTDLKGIDSETQAD